MRELPQQYLDNMTSQEYLDYQRDLGVWPELMSDHIANAIETEVQERLLDFDEDALNDALVEAWTDGLDTGRKEGSGG